MQDNFDLSVVVLIGLAIFVGWRLYSVLGTRVERDRTSKDGKRSKPVILPPSAEAEAPIRVERDAQPIDSAPSEPAPDRWKGVAEPGSTKAAALDALAAIEPGFEVASFVSGARAAYEAIVTAFASGDRATLKDLLSRDVFESFVQAIADREKRGETVETTFVSIDKSDVSDVQTRGKAAQITVRFQSKLITATRDGAGILVNGSLDRIADVTDIWTFARELGTRDPVWKLIATETGH